MPLFGAKASIGFALALLVPFAVTLSTNSEPYPAVVFPGGASVVRTNNSVVQYEATLLFGVDQSGTPTRLDVAAFLDPIPTHYLYALEASYFGLNDDKDLVIRVKEIGWTLAVPRPSISDADRQATQMWLGDRLEALGLERSVLIMQRVKVTADSNTGEELSRTTIRENTLDL